MSEGRVSQAVIRTAASTDLESLVSIETRAFDSDRISRRQFCYHLGKPQKRLFVAEIAGQVAGYILLFRQRGVARIYSLAVDASYRRLGIAHALCHHAESVARSAGARRLRLEVRIHNQPACTLYQSLGYHEIARLSAYYADGTDGIRLEKSLNCPNR